MADNDVETFLSSVGKRIQNLREFRGLSRREFGEALGLQGNSAGTGVYALEVGGAATRIDTIYKAAKVLDVTPGFLLDGGDLHISHTKAF
jgi:transcriptional regulator with XRE-family HTH domain